MPGPKHGQKTVQVSIRFFAKDIEQGKYRPNSGSYTPQKCLPRGGVQMKANDYHGIHPGPSDEVMFNSFDEIPEAIKKIMKIHGIQFAG